MPLAKLFLGAGVAIWLPYGLYLLAMPDALVEIGGVGGTTATGVTEIRAMYGGLQAGVGGLCLLGLLREQARHGVLVSLVFLTGGLALARAIGVVLDGSGSSYTWAALGFEVANTAIAFWLAGKEEPSAG